MANREDHTGEVAAEGEGAAEMAGEVEDGAVGAPTADAEDGAAATDEDGAETIESLRVALNEAQAALDEAVANAKAHEDRALRAAAEAENVRKRAERSIANARKFALEKFVADLLPAVDSFERAVEAAAGDSATEAMAEGIELSLKLLLEAMARQGIEVVDPVGAPFDPTLHEAMTMVDSAAAEPGSVLDVFQKGYTVNGRLVRPARVIVARRDTPPPADPAKP